jgi:hypothetical protein
MSQGIWTHCAARFRPRVLATPAFRAVEDQHVNSTRKLVDSDEEQALLEELIDGAKPPWPELPGLAGLHYLLATPFRHAPLRHGSRFGTRQENGIFYCAEARRVLFAEKAYYALLLFEGTAARIEPLTRPLTVFGVKLASRRAADLTRPPFQAFEAAVSSPSSYADSQPLGRALREAGVEICRYRSARDPARGKNFALFTPAFASKKPLRAERWICTASKLMVEFKPGLAVVGERSSFARSTFEVEGALPMPGA